MNNKKVQRTNGAQFHSAKTAMDIFSNYEQKREYVAIYVPSTIYDQQVDNHKEVEITMQAMSHIFGGATASKGHGGWYDGDYYISEDVVIVKSFCDNITGDMAEQTIGIAKALKESMQQACISVEYNGALMFV